MTTPAMLGLSGYTEIPRIYIGDCGAADTYHYAVSWANHWLGGAHTHNCPLDPAYNSICVSSFDELLDSAGEASPLLIHEYAHVLRGYPEGLMPTDCSLGIYQHQFTGPIEAFREFLDCGGHDKEWRKIMRSLGQEPTPNVRPSIKYEIAQVAQAAVVVVNDRFPNRA